MEPESEEKKKKRIMTKMTTIIEGEFEDKSDGGDTSKD